MADAELIRGIALKTGLGLKFISKDGKISDILMRLPEIIREKAVMKGGTALNRLYIKQRFSEDIDFDFPAESFSGMRSELKELMVIQGFDIRSPRRMVDTLRFDCGFVNEFGDKDMVKVEFTMVDRILGEHGKLVMNSFIYPAGGALVDAYSLEELIAQKLLCLKNRNEGKDIFDLYYALDMEHDREMLRSAVRKLAGGVDALKHDAAARLEDRMKDADLIAKATSHYIEAGKRPDWRIMIRDLAAKVSKI